MSRRKSRPNQPFLTPLRAQRVVIGRPQITGDLLPARVLIGWLTPYFDEYYLAGSYRPAPTASMLSENRQLLRQARRVRNQLVKADLGGAVTDLPPEHATYVARLLGDPAVQQKIKQGFELKLIDLHKVCVLQPVISLGRVARLTAALDMSDPLSVARLALPMTFAPRLILPSFSVQAHSMQVASVWTPQPTPPISHMHVVKLRDRYLMTDGHHRGYSFLRAGVQFVPGFFQAATTYAAIGMPPRLLPDTLLNETRPPLLTDFLIDGLAADIS